MKQVLLAAFFMAALSVGASAQKANPGANGHHGKTTVTHQTTTTTVNTNTNQNGTPASTTKKHNGWTKGKHKGWTKKSKTTVTTKM